MMRQYWYIAMKRQGTDMGGAGAAFDRYFRLVEKIACADDTDEMEPYLAAAFELGRSLINKTQVSPGEVINLHHEALMLLGRTYPDLSLAAVADRLTRPLLEMIMAYSLAHGLAFREHEIELASLERDFRVLVETSSDHIARHDIEGRISYVNLNLARMIGVPVSECLGKRLTEVVPGETFANYEAAIARAATTGAIIKFEHSIPGNDGSFQTHQFTITPERNEDGAVIGVLVCGRDITDILYYQQKMHVLAFVDGLTCLANRALFNERLSHAMADAVRMEQPLGLMLLDLDNFKMINDALGHAAGDRLLHEVARRLEKSVRENDTVARFGGDEFAILLPAAGSRETLGRIAGHILEILSEPYLVDAHELFVSASIGIVVHPWDSADAGTLLKHADCAMYHAKSEGRANFQFYLPELAARSHERMSLESALRKAVRNREFKLYYQPQVALDGGRLVGVEALLRWTPEHGGVVGPDKFIPVAEETGLIVSIGEWVLSEACTAAAAWNRGCATPLRVAVNLSTRQFLKYDLVNSICRILAETGCRPEWLKLEITESLLLKDSNEVLATLDILKGMGFDIAIDDFATGYSSLGYLNRFPVSQIKIDRSFVRDVPSNRNKSELVKALISIAQTLNLELVAEGVETFEQASYLQAHGCQVAQGFLFGKPMPRTTFEEMLRGERGWQGLSVPDGEEARVLPHFYEGRE